MRKLDEIKDDIIGIFVCILVMLVAVIGIKLLTDSSESSAKDEEIIETTVEEDASASLIEKDMLMVEYATEPLVVIIEETQPETQEEVVTEEVIEETLSKEDEMNLRILEIEFDRHEDTLEWFKEYKKITDEYREYLDVRLPETIYDVYTDEDIRIMSQCVETEVYTGDFNSKCNVASVIFNRVNSKAFPGDTPTDVVTAKYQFAYGRTKVTESSLLAVEYVYIFGDTTDGCVAFRSDKKMDRWYTYKKINYWEYQFTDKVGHHFFK